MLTSKKISVKMTIIPLVVSKLVEDYVDVILDELPDGLLLNRDIQHHIDLILGSVLPNQEAYHLNPSQYVKLRK